MQLDLTIILDWRIKLLQLRVRNHVYSVIIEVNVGSRKGTTEMVES